jgi:putative hydrolase of the HAD superfamily
MIKAVIFDYGGVIGQGYSWKDDIALAYDLKQEEVNPKMDLLMGDFRDGAITESEFWKKLSDSLGKSVPENASRLWRADYEKSFAEHEEVLDFVKELKSKGIKTAILSNTIIPHLEIMKQHNTLADFNVTVFSCEAGMSKPDPRIYMFTAEKLGAGPEECIFIDDLEKNLAPAKELGMEVILAQSPAQIIEAVKGILGW